MPDTHRDAQHRDAQYPGAPPTGIAAAVETLIAEHAAATAWADDLARELAAARARTKALAELIATAARLLPPAQRTAARAALTPTRTPTPGTRTAALAEFLHTHDAPFTPSDLTAWLRGAGHPIPAPRDAARLLGRAEKRGLVQKLGRGRYQAMA